MRFWCATSKWDLKNWYFDVRLPNEILKIDIFGSLYLIPLLFKTRLNQIAYMLCVERFWRNLKKLSVPLHVTADYLRDKISVISDSLQSAQGLILLSILWHEGSFYDLGGFSHQIFNRTVTLFSTGLLVNAPSVLLLCSYSLEQYSCFYQNGFFAFWL